MTTTTRRLRHPEKMIERDIILALRRLQFGVTKTSQPRPSMVTLGIPDLYAHHPRWGIRLWIEVKAPGNKPSDTQAAWHQAEREAGGVVLVAYSVADVVDELRRLGAPLT